MRSLVTGASGYLGQYLVPELRSKGVYVAASHFRGTPPPSDHALPGDLADASTLARLSEALRGTDTVYHLAGIAHQRAGAEEYRRVNLEATLALGRSARDAGVKRFVFVSSVKAQDAPASARGTPLDYGSSKRAAELALRELFVDSAMSFVVVRPALVYGGQESGHLALLRRWVQRRLPRPPAGGSLAMISRDDLVALLCAIGSYQGELPDLITATDGERYSTRRLHGAYCEAAKRRPLLPSPPAGLWCGASALRDLFQGQPVGTTWHRLTGELYCDAAGMDALSFVPRFTFEGSLGL